MRPIQKYPRTRHLEGSRFQPGDEDLSAIPFDEIAGRDIVIEEKLDGANCGISFDTSGELLLQSRGHYLTGGPRERQFTLFKQWAVTLQDALRQRLGSRYILYGEWLYSKHTVFYDALPHYFLEFDVFDADENRFLDTPCRRLLLEGLPIRSVPVLFSGRLKRMNDLTKLLRQSQFIRPGHLDRLREECRRLGLDADEIVRATDPSTDMEGLYIKTEEGGSVTGRCKYVRGDFQMRLIDADEHRGARPITPNLLAEGAELFSLG